MSRREANWAVETELRSRAIITALINDDRTLAATLINDDECPRDVVAVMGSLLAGMISGMAELRGWDPAEAWAGACLALKRQDDDRG